MNILEQLKNESTPKSELIVGFQFTNMLVKKGVKKTPFIEGVDDPKYRKLQIDITFQSDSSEWTSSYLSFDKTWQSIVWPSLASALPNAKDMSDFDGLWEVEFVNLPQTYTNRDGEEKNRTAPKFIKRVGDSAMTSASESQLPPF